MEAVVNGTVQVAGATNRIVRLKRDRIRDELGNGSFTSWPAVEMQSVGVRTLPMQEVERVAAQLAQPSWAGRLALS